MACISIKRLFIVSISILSSVMAHSQNGELFNVPMNSSTYYPGTERSLNVYVPDGYDGKRDACLIIKMDGFGEELTSAMDTLIANGNMPVSIAIGINPGRIYDTKHKKVIRYNRSNEFDRTDGTFAAFLEYEVIPLLEKQKTPSGKGIRISRLASDRLIMGESSGAIAAFNAAWQRPDLFSRVYSMIGTYVPFRYGDQFPGIIRKTEPKCLRVFFQDNKDDCWNPIFGSWYEANRMMLSAMQFAGYEVNHQWDEGYHDGINGNAILSRVLTWLWAGWPQEVGIGTSENGTLASILDPTCPQWKKVRDGIKEGSRLESIEGEDEPAVTKESKKFNPLCAIYPGGGMKATATKGNCWIKNAILQDDSFVYDQEYYCLHSPATQICFDTNGYLYCATQHGIQICDHNGRVRAILSIPAGPVSAIAFVGNKLWAISGGTLWVRTLKRSGFVDPASVPEPKREGQG